MEQRYYVYILSNNSFTLYIGYTSNLPKRLEEHKDKVVEGFTKKYNVNKLVYVEVYETAFEALSRERQLKKWRRSKKIVLIKTMNLSFEDISLTVDI